MNTTNTRRPLGDYLNRAYRFNVIADPDGGYVVEYPDLPGCLTQVETIEEIAPMAEEARRLWLRAAYEQGLSIPEPSYPETYSGKFNVRVPRSLHRRLAEQANDDGTSLNQLVVSLLSESLVERQSAARMDAVVGEIRSLRRVIARGGQPRREERLPGSAPHHGSVPMHVTMGPPRRGASSNWISESGVRTRRRVTDRAWGDVSMQHVPADVAPTMEFEMEQVA